MHVFGAEPEQVSEDVIVNIENKDIYTVHCTVHKHIVCSILDLGPLSKTNKIVLSLLVLIFLLLPYSLCRILDNRALTGLQHVDGLQLLVLFIVHFLVQTLIVRFFLHIPH